MSSEKAQPTDSKVTKPDLLAGRVFGTSYKYLDKKEKAMVSGLSESLDDPTGWIRAYVDRGLRDI